MATRRTKQQGISTDVFNEKVARAASGWILDGEYTGKIYARPEPPYDEVPEYVLTKLRARDELGWAREGRKPVVWYINGIEVIEP